MKKNVVLRFAEISLLVLSSASLHAQTAIKSDMVSTKSFTTAPGVAYNDFATLNEIKAVSEKTFRSITREYPAASRLSFSTSKNRMMIHFKMNGDHYQLLYSKRGHWIQTIHTYDFSKLAQDLKDRVQDAYPRYELCSVVNEISLGIDKVYLIRIEDKKSWKILRLTEDELDVYEAYRK